MKISLNKDEMSSLSTWYTKNIPRQAILDRFPKYTWEQIKGKANRMGLTRHPAQCYNSNLWTAAEEMLVAELYPSAPQEMILKRIPKKTRKAISFKAFQMGIRRGKQEFNAVESHHRKMIRKYFGDEAVQEHIRAQQKMRTA